ncbi:MAG: hypothetical protein HBSIN02_04220 [Bacteroidia bacterium]|nr:MAG: hypothetical protein HBSIN02_04220 [Bacteroidia bacterium]
MVTDIEAGGRLIGEILEALPQIQDFLRECQAKKGPGFGLSKGHWMNGAPGRVGGYQK